MQVVDVVNRLCFAFVTGLQMTGIGMEVKSFPCSILTSGFSIENSKSHVERGEIESTMCIKIDLVHVKYDRHQNLVVGRITFGCYPRFSPPATVMKLLSLIHI